MKNFYLKHSTIIEAILTLFLVIISGISSYCATNFHPAWIMLGIIGIPTFLFILAKCDDIKDEQAWIEQWEEE